MKLSQYGYEFKPEMLAKYPAENRDEARLMVVNRAKGTIEHRIFKDIIDYFDEGDLFVFNDTKVFPARLYGNKEKTGAEIEIFLLRELNRELRLWDVLVDPARKIRIGNKLYFGDDDLMVAEVIDNTTSRGRTLRFLFDGDYDEFKTALFKLGETPLPRWVREKVEPEDSERYQTIFAAKEGAVVAPTAGMHFSKHLMKRMEIPMMRNIRMPVKKAGAMEAAIPQPSPWARTPPQPNPRKKPMPDLMESRPTSAPPESASKSRSCSPRPKRESRNSRAPTPVAAMAMMKKIE